MSATPKDWRGPAGAAIAIAGAGSWFFRYPDAVSDISWHLAAGREITSLRAIPSTDPFSYTFADHLWMNHEWLWQVIFWNVYRIHPDAAAWLNIGILTAIFGISFFVSCDAGRRANAGEVSTDALWAAGAATWAGAAASFWFLDIRPHLSTLLLVTVVLVTRRRRWAPWLWPPLIVVWTNLHAGFVFGIGAIGLLVIVNTVERSLPEKRLVLDRRELLALSVCLVAWILNPWGLTLAEYPLAYAQDSAYKSLNEWQSTPFDFHPMGFAGRFWGVALLAAAGAIVRAKREPYLVALSLVTFTMALVSRRFIPLFVVTAMPLLAVAFALGFRAASRFVPERRRVIAGSVGWIAAVVTCVVLWSDVRIGPQLFRRWTSFYSNPEAAVRYLRALGPPGRTLNHYSWGGYLQLEGGGTKVFIDERANTIYDDAIYLDYLALVQGTGGTARLTRPTPDVALVPRAGLARTLAGQQPPWRPIYGDARGVILAPPGSPLFAADLPRPEEVVGDEPDWLLSRAMRAQATGDVAAAREWIERAIARDPLVLRSHAALAQLDAAAGDVAGIERTIAAALEISPRHRERILVMAARAYFTAGALERAREALRRSVPRSPFTPREPHERLVAEVERRMASR